MLVIICGSAFSLRLARRILPERMDTPAKAAGKTFVRDKNWRSMLSDPVFYVMLIMLCCGAFSGLMVTSQASPVAQEMIGMTAAEAAVAVSILALFNTMGRILAGSLSDHFGAVNTIRGVFLVSIAGLALLYASGEGSVATFYVGVCVVGLSFGSIMGNLSRVYRRRVWLKNNSVNYGIMFIGFATAGCFGPIIMSVLYQSVGSYQSAFLAAAALATVGVGLTVLFKRIRVQHD